MGSSFSLLKSSIMELDTQPVLRKGWPLKIERVSWRWEQKTVREEREGQRKTTSSSLKFSL